MSPLEQRLRALLRWYPRVWRERHGEVVLAMLLDDADARRVARPTRADAWSIRMQGLAERATPRAAAVVAGVGVVLSAVLLGLRRLVWSLTTAPTGERLADDTGMLIVSIAGNVGVAAPLLAIALLMLVAWRRASGAALLVAGVAVLAASFVLAGAALWSVAHPTVVTTSDGMTSSSAGVVAAPAAVMALLIAAVGIVPLVRAWLPLREHHPLGWPLALVCSFAPAAVGIALGQTSLTPFVGIAIVLLVVTGGVRRSRPVEHGHAEGAASPRPTWSPRTVGLLAAVTVVVALPLSAVGVLAGFDVVMVADAGMRLVGAVAVASALAVIAAIALVVRARLGDVVWVPAAAFAISTVVAAVAAAMGDARPAYVPVTMVAAGFAGLGIALTMLLATSGGPIVRAVMAFVVGTSAAALLAQLLPFLAALAWVLAVPLVVLAVRRIRGGAGTTLAAAATAR